MTEMIGFFDVIIDFRLFSISPQRAFTRALQESSCCNAIMQLQNAAIEITVSDQLRLLTKYKFIQKGLK
jgi:hypothetical protein